MYSSDMNQSYQETEPLVSGGVLDRIKEKEGKLENKKETKA